MSPIFLGDFREPNIILAPLLIWTHVVIKLGALGSQAMAGLKNYKQSESNIRS